MNEEELLNKLKEQIENYNFANIFNQRLTEHFEKYDTYYHISTVEEFMGFNDRICKDYSGEVERFKTNKDIINFINDFIPCGVIDDNILANLYNGQKEASYCSGFGWHYVSLSDELERLFDEQKNNLYCDFVMKNKADILGVYNFEFESDEDYKDMIYDYLDCTSLSDYMVFESYEPLQEYLNSMNEEAVIKIIEETI